ncbi:hypothetical protein ES703_44033 [subsurface metagenome]
MAKLKGPFMSLGASGQLGKTLVAFPWKGLHCLRTYVVPANPQTDAQTVQRNFFTDAVTAWHTAAYNALDAVAWNRLAGIADKIMSGFNRMIREHIEEAILGNAWELLHHVEMATITQTDFVAFVGADDGGNAPVLHYGKSKTHMPDTFNMTVYGTDIWAAQPAGLIANTLYYFYIDMGTSAADYARTGIYTVRTLPA